MNDAEGSFRNFVAVFIGMEEVPDPGIMSVGLEALLFVWLASCWHRTAVMIGALDFNLDSVVVWIPGCVRPFRVWLVQGRWVLWFVLVVLFGLCGFAEAQEVSEVWLGSGQVQVGGLSFEQVQMLGWEQETLGRRGLFVLEECVKALCVITAWESLKRLMCRHRRKVETVGSQTVGTKMVPLPLEAGVRNRAQILFCFWRAGYEADIQEYPMDIQEDYFNYVGSFLRRQAVDEVDSD